MNFAVTQEHQDNWPKENTPARFASMEWHWRAERTRPLLSCHLASFSYLWAGKHMWLGKGKNRLPKLWPSTNPSVFGKARTVNTTFSPGLSQLAGGCIPLKQHFRKKKLELGLNTSLPAFLCYKLLRQESMSLLISLQGHSLEQGHSKAESAQSCLRFLKFISEDTIWQRMCCSFGAITGNLQTSNELCDGLPTCQFYQQRDTGLSLVWDEFHGAYLQTRGRKTASVKVNSLDTSQYWPTSYSFISKSKKIWPIPTAHPPHDIYK